MDERMVNTMRLARMALMTCLVVGPVLVLAGCGTGAKARSKTGKKVGDVKDLIAYVQGTFEQGRTERERPPEARGGGRPDSSVPVVNLMMEKLHRNISNRVKNDEKRTAALAKLQEARDYFANEFMPKYVEARKSKDPEDAKNLVSHMEKLNAFMDEILAIL